MLNELKLNFEIEVDLELLKSFDNHFHLDLHHYTRLYKHKKKWKPCTCSYFKWMLLSFHDKRHRDCDKEPEQKQNNNTIKQCIHKKLQDLQTFQGRRMAEGPQINSTTAAPMSVRRWFGGLFASVADACVSASIISMLF